MTEPSRFPLLHLLYQKKEVKTIEKKGKFDQRTYIIQYQKEHYKRVVCRLSVSKDQDIIEALQNVDNVNEFVKDCIREKLNKK